MLGISSTKKKIRIEENRAHLIKTILLFLIYKNGLLLVYKHERAKNMYLVHPFKVWLIVVIWKECFSFVVQQLLQTMENIKDEIIFTEMKNTGEELDLKPTRTNFVFVIYFMSDHVSSLSIVGFLQSCGCIFGCCLLPQVCGRRPHFSAGGMALWA